MKNHTQNLLEKLVLDLFLKNQNWAYLWINTEYLHSLFYCMSKLRAIKIYWNQGDHFFLCHAQLFPYFLQDFSKKNIFHGPTFIVWLRLRLEILCNVCIVIICFLVCDVVKSENKVSFLIKPLPYITKIVRTSFNILRMKRAVKMKWKSFWKCFHASK